MKADSRLELHEPRFFVFKINLLFPSFKCLREPSGDPGLLIARVDLKEGVGKKPERGMSAVKFIYRSALRVAVHGSRCSCVHARVAGLELPVSAVRVLPWRGVGLWLTFTWLILPAVVLTAV